MPPLRIQSIRAWFPDLDDTPRFFWHDFIGPVVGSISQLFEYDLYDLGSVVNSDSTVYHYTDAAALLPILTTRSLWLTDYSYLNDATEVQHGVALARSALSELVPNDDPARSFLEAALSNTDAPSRVAIACFSLMGDSLSQWRAYSRNRCGVAIGFRPSVIAKALGMNYLAMTDLTFSQVLYGSAQKELLFQRLIHYHKQAWEYDRHGPHQTTSATHAAVLKAHLFRLASLCKDEGFADEREFRLIYHDSETAIPPIPKRFRVTESLIVPYVSTTDIARHYYEASEFVPEVIVVGPHPQGDLVLQGARELLNDCGFHHVPVVKSTIPFR